MKTKTNFECVALQQQCDIGRDEKAFEKGNLKLPFFSIAKEVAIRWTAVAKLATMIL